MIRVFFHISPILLGISQNVIGIKIRTITSLIQFDNGLDDEGSKTEKMFVIIIIELSGGLLGLELNFFFPMQC